MLAHMRRASWFAVSTALVVVASTASASGEAPAGQSAAADSPVSLVRSFQYGGALEPSQLAAAGGTLFFEAMGLEEGDRPTLWKSDGTEAGTVAVVRELDTPEDYARPTDMIGVGNTLFFTLGSQLWRSDGTAAGTYGLTQLPGSASLQSFSALGDVLVFVGADDEVWRSDGTVAGTYRVADVNPGPTGSRPFPLTVVGGWTYFDAYDGTERAIWRSDGTAAGTTKVVPSGTRGARDLAAFGQTVYYTVHDEASDGVELWRSDGTPAGTTRLSAAVNAATRSGMVADLTMAGSTLYFTTNGAQEFGRALWKSDGTVAGTVQVADLGPDTNWYPLGLTPLGSKVLFKAKTAATGEELWVSDGTAAGTGLIADIDPGPADGYPSQFELHGGALYFQARSGGQRSLWTSDGSAAGTRRVDDLVWPTLSGPQWITSTGTNLFFVGDLGGRREIRTADLWKLGGAGGDSSVSGLRVRTPKRVKVGGKVKIPVRVSAGEALTVKVVGRARVGKGRANIKLKPARADVAAGVTRKVSITAGRASKARILKAVRAWRAAPAAKKKRLQVSVLLKVRALDSSGASATVKKVVRLR